MSSDEMSAVAVVNGDADMMAIWHVAAEPIVQTSRLCGAWVTNELDVQRKVIASRKVALLADESSDYIKTLLTHANNVIDLNATLLAIARYTDGLDEIHRASLTPKGSSRAPISWPVVHRVPDWNPHPLGPAGDVEDPLIHSTITFARYLASLADTWSAIETTRTSKPHLSIDNSSPLPLPFVPTEERPSAQV